MAGHVKCSMAGKSGRGIANELRTMLVVPLAWELWTIIYRPVVSVAVAMRLGHCHTAILCHATAGGDWVSEHYLAVSWWEKGSMIIPVYGGESQCGVHRFHVYTQVGVVG